jgi:cytochrome c peroxidase
VEARAAMARIGRGVLGWMLLASCGCNAVEGPWPGDPPPVDPAAPVFTETELYAIRESLATLPAAPPPDPSNRYGDHPGAAVLGQKLYFDARYSANGQVSCATCHDPRAGFQDARDNTSLGLGYTGRHAPTVINAAHGSGDPASACWHFWDGRADSQWAQALGPPESAVEMGGTRTRIAILVYDHYRSEYEAVFGPMPPLRDGQGTPMAPDSAMPGQYNWAALTQRTQEQITGVYVNFGKAIAAYERRIVSRNSRFDRFYAELAAGAEDSAHLDAQEKLGLKVFVGKGRCVSCHGGGNFTDWKFHNIAEPQTGEHLAAEDPGRTGGVPSALQGEFNCLSQWSDQPDKSRCAVSSLQARDRDLGAFKTPGLRDVSKTAPYMHTGRLRTLDEVVEHYDQGGARSGFSGKVDQEVRKLDLTGEEKRALVRFMLALDGEPLPTSLTQAPALPGLP